MNEIRQWVTKIKGGLLMSKPTIVTLRYGTSADGYTFIATNYRNIEYRLYVCSYKRKQSSRAC